MLGEKRQNAQNQWGTSPGSLGRGRSTVPAEKVRENHRAPLTPSATDGPPSLPKKSGRIPELPWLARLRTVHSPCRKETSFEGSLSTSLRKVKLDFEIFFYQVVFPLSHMLVSEFGVNASLSTSLSKVKLDFEIFFNVFFYQVVFSLSHMLVSEFGVNASLSTSLSKVQLFQKTSQWSRF